jgi:putative peptide zinc metalloprotease protein
MSASQLMWRNDLVVSRQGTTEEAMFVVKDPANGRFFRLREAEHFIARQLDGATTLDELQRRVEEKFGDAIRMETLERFVERLQGLGLLARAGSATASVAQPRSRIAGDLFYMRLKAFDPDRFFTWLLGQVRFFFTPLFVASSAALIVFALGLTVANWPEISRQFLDLFHFESLLLVWIVALGVITLHEFAHGVTCKHFGGHVHELGFLLLYFQPAFYCNVSDAWLFPEKSKRLWVTFAGAYFEMFLWALATVVWRLADTDTLINHLALVVVATSAIKSLFNLNPLIKLDGYYLLSDWLDIPNLRQKAGNYLRSSFTRLFGGRSEMATQVTSRERRIYLAYGLLAGGYTYWLLTWIASKVGSFLVGRYEAWGFVLFATLLVGLFRNPIRHSFSVCAAAAAAGKLRLVKKLAKVLLFFGGLGAALYLCRMELKVSVNSPSCRFTMPTRDEVEGIIQEIYHDEGDVVSQGEVIARGGSRPSRGLAQARR